MIGMTQALVILAGELVLAAALLLIDHAQELRSQRRTRRGRTERIQRHRRLWAAGGGSTDER